MNAAGFTETIWHFAGYLHISDALARSSEIYDGAPAVRPPDEPGAMLRDAGARPDFDDLSSRPVLLPESPPLDPGHLIPIPRMAIPGVPMPGGSVVPTPLPYKPAALQPLSFQEGDGPGLAVPRHIAVTYEDGGYESLVAVKQIHAMEDRDTLIAQGLRGADGEPVVPPAVDTSLEISQMLARALDETPETLPRHAAGDATSLIASVEARDAGWRASGEAPDEGATATPPVGRIVDGVVSDAPLPVIDPLEIAPWRVPTEAAAAQAESRIDGPAPAQGVATVVEAGQNTQVNAALIVDANEASGSLMIGGDYFFSRGIVQVNILTDSDRVDIARSVSASPFVRADGNQVHNIAEFVVHDIALAHRGAAATPHWQVDVFRGDFYDVKSVVQFNGLDDNDRSVQVTAGTYFDARTGGNDQDNLAKVSGFDSYDIIIVGGSYHRADWIFQYNVMLDSDVAKIVSAGNADDTGAEVSAGFNRLVNDASITTYDSAAFKALNDAQRNLLEGLDQNVSRLTPDADWQLTGSASGTLKILYVKGDYYDVNTITQVNVMSDVDQSVQASTTDDSGQGVSTGGNTMLNEARIVDPGALSTSKYLGGDAYEASILVQANIVTDDDRIVIHDTSLLAPELAVFASEPEDDGGHPEPGHGGCSGGANDHLMSQMLS